MAYVHTQVVVQGDTSVELIATGWTAIYVQNNSPSMLRIMIGATATNTTGLRVLPNSIMPLPIAAETAAGAINGILETPGAGDVNIDLLSFTP